MIGLVILLAVQHAVISARAGLVTYTEGSVNTEVSAHVGEGKLLETGPSGRAEIMLHPDSYLRVSPYTSVRLVSEQLDRIELELTEGAAIAAIDSIDEDLPILVRLGGLEVSIREAGIYLFEPDRVSVLEGELRFGARGERLREGRSLARGGESFTEMANGEDLERHDLVRWNDARTTDLAPRGSRRPRPFRF